MKLLAIIPIFIINFQMTVTLPSETITCFVSHHFNYLINYTLNNQGSICIETTQFLAPHLFNGSHLRLKVTFQKLVNAGPNFKAVPEQSTSNSLSNKLKFVVSKF